MAKRFVLAFVAFVSLILPLTFGMALLAAQAAPRPAAVAAPGCAGHLQQANATFAAWRSRLLSPRSDAAQTCRLTRQYFLDAVKARAMAAQCAPGAEREHALVALDADVERINDRVAIACR